MNETNGVVSAVQDFIEKADRMIFTYGNESYSAIDADVPPKVLAQIGRHVKSRINAALREAGAMPERGAE